MGVLHVVKSLHITCSFVIVLYTLHPNVQTFVLFSFVELVEKVMIFKLTLLKQIGFGVKAFARFQNRENHETFFWWTDHKSIYMCCFYKQLYR